MVLSFVIVKVPMRVFKIMKNGLFRFEVSFFFCVVQISKSMISSVLPSKIQEYLRKFNSNIIQTWYQ